MNVTSTVLDAKIEDSTKFLFAVNAKAARTGAPVFAGIDPVEKRRRRSVSKAARRSRRANRGR